MKADKILEALMEIAKNADFNVRRETGTFRGGACVVRDERLILINRSMPIEAAAVILARALVKIGIEKDTFLKPAVREILEREQLWVDEHPEVTFELSGKEQSAV